MPKKRGNRKKGKVPKSTKQYVKKMIDRDMEVKRLDTVSAVIASALAGQMVYLSGIPQGNTDISRIGSVIKPVLFRLRYWVYNTAALDPTNFRVILFQYKSSVINNVGAAPFPSDVIEDSNAAAATNWNSGYRESNTQALHILYDKTHSIIGSNTASNPKTSIFVQKTIPHRRLLKTIQYTGVGGTVVSAASNAVFCLFISGSTNVNYQYSAQLHFKDA